MAKYLKTNVSISRFTGVMTVQAKTVDVELKNMSERHIPQNPSGMMVGLHGAPGT